MTTTGPTLLPTVFHITHWKAGSQWVHRILHGLVYDRLVVPRQDQGQFLADPIQPGRVYPTLYVTREQLESVLVPADHRRFVIIRDLRDTLVSLYFSIKISHPVPDGGFGRDRAVLGELPQEAGLLHVLRTGLPQSAAIQASWVKSGEPLLRYEALLGNDLGLLADVLLRECQLEVPLDRFIEVVLANRFERITGGRPRGEEDVTAHERKGVQGDWRRYFTEPVRRAFKDEFGDLLVATGYEADLDW